MRLPGHQHVITEAAVQCFALYFLPRSDNLCDFHFIVKKFQNTDEYLNLMRVDVTVYYFRSLGENSLERT